MLFVLIAVVLCVLLHVSAMALAGVALGVTLREVSIGFGPTILRIGRLKIRMLPIAGSVRFKDSREEVSEEWDADADGEDLYSEPDEVRLDQVSLDGALDQRSPMTQISIGLAGCAALVVLACVIWQVDGIHAVIDGFSQIVTGAISPFDTAQVLIADAQQVLAGMPFLGVLGLVAAKFAAFNLLPLPAANGGFVLAAIGRSLGVDRAWPASLTTGLLLVYIGIALSWLVAFGTYWLR